MLSTYRAVFRTPGTAAFSVAGFVMRLPIAIYPIAMILMVSARTHHYGFAGLLSAAYVLGGAPGNPIGARLVDRFGQRRMLLPATVVHLAAVITLIALVEANAPDWSLLLPAAVAGGSYLSVGSLVRARWSHMLADGPELATAYSMESTLDEVIFVLGPLIATVVATEIDPVLPLVIAGLLVAGGAVALGRQRATEPAAHPVGTPPHRSAMRYGGMGTMLGVSISMGAVFATAEVSLVAFCGQHGHQSLSGVVLAGMALGSAVSGFFYGSRTWRAELADRFRIQAIAFGLLSTVLLAAVNVPALAVCVFVLGMGVAPTLITCFALIARLVPGHSLTEGLAWLTTGLNLGYGGGSSLAGRIADADGARAAFLLTIAAGVLVACFGLRLHAVLRRSAPVEPAVSTA